MKIIKFLDDLEFILEMDNLKKLGLSEEEISGYFEFYANDWVKDLKEDNYVN